MQSLQLLMENLTLNWSNIVLILISAVAVVISAKRFLKMSKKEKVEAALSIIKEELLHLMINAELDWLEIAKSGKLKKSQVISKIYEQFPFLQTFVDQKYLLNTIDLMIDEVKEELDKLLEDTTGTNESIDETIDDILDEVDDTKSNIYIMPDDDI